MHWWCFQPFNSDNSVVLQQSYQLPGAVSKCNGLQIAFPFIVCLMIPKLDQSVEVNNCYTTWKVEGTIPMYWFIMAPYFSPLFGLVLAIYCQYVFGDAATWLARLVSANEPANMVVMLKNISYKLIHLKHTNLGNLDLVPIIWPVVSISIMSISLLLFYNILLTALAHLSPFPVTCRGEAVLNPSW